LVSVHGLKRTQKSTDAKSVNSLLALSDLNAKIFNENHFMTQKTQMIHEKMKVNEIVLNFPPKAQKLRRAIKNFASFPHDLPEETLEIYLAKSGKNQSETAPFLKRLNDILEEQTVLNEVSFTEKAAIKLKEILSEEQKVGWGVKFADQPAACGAGFEYILEPSFHPDPTDRIFHSHGIEISVPSICIDRLIGSLIDFEEGFIDDNFTGLIKLGFTIANPNVKCTCDCGCSAGYGA
jgi:iron-sulfur cluster assembly protein